MVRGAAAALALAGLVVYGCQDVDHPPGADLKCQADANCVKPPPSGVTPDSGGPTDGGTAGDAGTTTVEGTVAIFTADDFVTATAFADTATIEMESATLAPISTGYDGVSFSLAGVRVATDVWATVFPSASDALTTVQLVDTTQAAPVQLFLVPESILQVIYGVLTNPTVPAAGSAQVVLRFVDATSGDPVSGVSVSHAAETIAYDANGTYSDDVFETGQSGIAILVNVPALQTAVKSAVQVDDGSSVGAVDVLMRADAVTLVDIAVSP